MTPVTKNAIKRAFIIHLLCSWIKFRIIKKTTLKRDY